MLYFAEILVLRNNSAKIIELAEPVEFGNYLVSEELISYQNKDDILSILSLSRYEKGSRMLSCFEEVLSNSDNKKYCLLQFCEMLCKMNNPGLKRVSQEIKKSLGKPNHQSQCFYKILFILKQYNGLFSLYFQKLSTKMVKQLLLSHHHNMIYKSLNRSVVYRMV